MTDIWGYNGAGLHHPRLSLARKVAGEVSLTWIICLQVSGDFQTAAEPTVSRRSTALTCRKNDVTCAPQLRPTFLKRWVWCPFLPGSAVSLPGSLFPHFHSNGDIIQNQCETQTWDTLGYLGIGHFPPVIAQEMSPTLFCFRGIVTGW